MAPHRLGTVSQLSCRLGKMPSFLPTTDEKLTKAGAMTNSGVTCIRSNISMIHGLKHSGSKLLGSDGASIGNKFSYFGSLAQETVAKDRTISPVG